MPRTRLVRAAASAAAVWADRAQAASAAAVWAAAWAASAAAVWAAVALAAAVVAAAAAAASKLSLSTLSEWRPGGRASVRLPGSGNADIQISDMHIQAFSCSQESVML